jgi:hypothetical protein
MESATEVEYRAKKGRSLSSSLAELVGPEIRALSQEADEEVTPAEYLNWVATHPYSESHALFEWDDTEASKQYRLSQARNIINSIEIKIIDHRGDEAFVPAWLNVRVQSEEEGASRQVYTSFESVVNDNEKSQIVVTQARKEFISWRRRFLLFRNELPLAAIFAATDELELEEEG